MQQYSIAKTIIYDLINAGYLARKAMLTPLQIKGLVLGDDAIIFALYEQGSQGERELAQLIGLDMVSLDNRLARLSGAGVIERAETGEDNSDNISLTKRGKEISEYLIAYWIQIEDALIGELDMKDSKKLRKILKRFIKLLSL